MKWLKIIWTALMLAQGNYKPIKREIEEAIQAFKNANADKEWTQEELKTFLLESVDVAYTVFPVIKELIDLFAEREALKK
jgi:hypothetical protein